MIKILVSLILSSGLLLNFSGLLPAQEAKGAVLVDQTVFWEPYQTLLETYLTRARRDGIELSVLDYRRLKDDPVFAEMVKKLEKFSLLTLRPGDDALAFWINAYNFLAIKLVADNYPVESIKDIGSLFSSVWNQEAGVIGGKVYSLGEIEHQILRKFFPDPRLHFAIVCASLSCPDLKDEIYSGELIDVQLDAVSRIFLQNPAKGLRPGPEKNRITVSQIFDWFEEDFEKGGGVEKFIRKYHPELGLESESKIDYLPYNWNLNGTK